VSAALQLGALLCTAFAVLAGSAVLARARDVRLGVQVLVELLLCAGLLRLAGNPGWAQILTVSTLVAVRLLLPLGARRPA
jgi:hypothetical protein